MKTFWILMAIISMEGNSDLQTYEVYKFNEPEFENELECIGFAQKNYISINNHVNLHYKTDGKKYDFACLSDVEYYDLLASQETNK